MIDGGVEAGPAAAAVASVGFFSEGRRLCEDEIMGVCVLDGRRGDLLRLCGALNRWRWCGGCVLRLPGRRAAD